MLRLRFFKLIALTVIFFSFSMSAFADSKKHHLAIKTHHLSIKSHHRYGKMNSHFKKSVHTAKWHSTHSRAHIHLKKSNINSNLHRYCAISNLPKKPQYVTQHDTSSGSLNSKTPIHLNLNLNVHNKHTPAIKNGHKQPLKTAQRRTSRISVFLNAMIRNMYIGAYGGYGIISGGSKQTGHTPQGRACLGFDVKNYRRVIFGTEVGIQSGDDINYYINPQVINLAGGLPVSAVIKPMIDALITAKFSLFNKKNLFGFIKGGIAYRETQFVLRSSREDHKSQFDPEFQMGLAYHITRQTKAVLFYQGIYSSIRAGIKLAATGDDFFPITYDLLINRIPTQQAGFFGIEYTF